MDPCRSAVNDVVRPKPLPDRTDWRLATASGRLPVPSLSPGTAVSSRHRYPVTQAPAAQGVCSTRRMAMSSSTLLFSSNASSRESMRCCGEGRSEQRTAQPPGSSPAAEANEEMRAEHRSRLRAESVGLPMGICLSASLPVARQDRRRPQHSRGPSTDLATDQLAQRSRFHVGRCFFDGAPAL